MQKKQEIQGLGRKEEKVGIHTNRKENTKSDLRGRGDRRKENGTNQTKGKFYMSWYRAGRSMRESCSGRREHTQEQPGMRQRQQCHQEEETDEPN